MKVQIFLICIPFASLTEHGSKGKSVKWKSAFVTSLMMAAPRESSGELLPSADNAVISTAPCPIAFSPCTTPESHHSNNGLEKRSVIKKQPAAVIKVPSSSVIQTVDPSFLLFGLLKDHLSLQDLRSLRGVNRDFREALRPLFDLKTVCKAESIYPSLVLTSSVLDDICLNLLLKIGKSPFKPPFISITVSDWRAVPILPGTELLITDTSSINSDATFNDMNRALRNASPFKLTIDLGKNNFAAGSFFINALHGCPIRELFLQRLPIKMDALSGLRRFLESSETIESLQISPGTFFAGDWRYLASAVLASRTLRSFSYGFGNHLMTNREATALQQILAHNQLEKFEMLLSDGKKLSDLRVDRAGFTDFGADGLRLATNLKQLTLLIPAESDAEFLGPVLHNLNQIESLTVGVSSLIGTIPNQITRGLLNSAKPRLKSLKILTEDNNNGFTDQVQFIEPILSHLPELESLELRVNAIDQALLVITRAVHADPKHKLKSLKVDVPRRIHRHRLSTETNAGIEAILPRLEKFSLSGANFPIHKCRNATYNLQSLEIDVFPVFSKFWVFWKKVARSIVESTNLVHVKVWSSVEDRNIAYSMAGYLNGARSLNSIIISDLVFIKNPKTGIFESPGFKSTGPRKSPGFKSSWTSRVKNWSLLEETVYSLKIFSFSVLAFLALSAGRDPCYNLYGDVVPWCEETHDPCYNRYGELSPLCEETSKGAIRKGG